MVNKMDRALIIRQPWIDLILSGEKRWEMRSKPTNIRGRIGLIEQGTGLIVGECNLDYVGEPITNFDQGYGQHLHKIPNDILYQHDFKWVYPWVLSAAKRYKSPIKYNHKRGAVTWIRLDN